jgi:hypothetical protein
VAERTAELQKERDSLEKNVVERTAALQEKLNEVNNFNDLTVGRELKMIEMDKELTALREENAELKLKKNQ